MKKQATIIAAAVLALTACSQIKESFLSHAVSKAAGSWECSLPDTPDTGEKLKLVINKDGTGALGVGTRSSRVALKWALSGTDLDVSLVDPSYGAQSSIINLSRLEEGGVISQTGEAGRLLLGAEWSSDVTTDFDRGIVTLRTHGNENADTVTCTKQEGSFALEPTSRAEFSAVALANEMKLASAFPNDPTPPVTPYLAIKNAVESAEDYRKELASEAPLRFLDDLDVRVGTPFPVDIVENGKVVVDEDTVFDEVKLVQVTLENESVCVWVGAYFAVLKSSYSGDLPAGSVRKGYQDSDRATVVRRTLDGTPACEGIEHEPNTATFGW